MRKLNKKQKGILDNWLKENLTVDSGLNIYFTVEDDLPYEIFKAIEDINNFEILNQEIENYVIDMIME